MCGEFAGAPRPRFQGPPERRHCLACGCGVGASTCGRPWGLRQVPNVMLVDVAKVPPLDTLQGKMEEMSVSWVRSSPAFYRKRRCVSCGRDQPALTALSFLEKNQCVFSVSQAPLRKQVIGRESLILPPLPGSPLSFAVVTLALLLLIHIIHICISCSLYRITRSPTTLDLSRFCLHYTPKLISSCPV